MKPLAFAVPGDLDTPTGGYAYDKRMIAELKALGWDIEVIDLGKHKLRLLETPHVHRWGSMMLFDETTKSVFPSDLFIQPVISHPS